MNSSLISAREDRAPYGIMLMLIAYLMFSCIDTSAKWLALLGLPALQLSFMRYVGHFVISTALLSSDGFSLARFKTPHLGLTILRASCLMIATILNFIAVNYLPLTLTATILFSSPIIICFLSWPLLGERVGLYRWIAIIFGFIGVTVAIRPFDDSFQWAMLLSLMGAFLFALYSILTRHLSGKVSVDIMQFYSGATGTFILLPFALWQWQSPDNAANWVFMISLGIFGWGGHQLLTTAHRFAPASTLMPFGYSFILYLTIWSFIMFDYLPDRWTIAGASIIIISGIIIWYRETFVKTSKSAL